MDRKCLGFHVAVLFLASVLTLAARAETLNIAAALGFDGLMELGDAIAAYEAGEHAQARRAFRHLAELGDPQARLNLALMLLRAEGGDADQLEALAWLQWASEDALATAVSARDALSDFFEADAGLAVAARLDQLKDAHPLRWPLPRQDGRERSEQCRAALARRRPPEYPREVAANRQIASASVELLTDEEGRTLIAVAHDQPASEPQIMAAAEAAATTWDLSDCGFRNELISQHFDFRLSDDGSRPRRPVRAYSSASRSAVRERVQRAQQGDSREAFVVWHLHRSFPGLVAMDDQDVLELLRLAAVRGHAHARRDVAELFNWAGMPDHAARMRVLAAGQGEAVSSRLLSLRAYCQPELSQRLLDHSAQRGDLISSLVLARTSLASERADRAAMAVAITGALDATALRAHPSLAETHARALAELGRFDQAQEWQQAAVDRLRALRMDTGEASGRLQHYAAGGVSDQALLVPALHSADPAQCEAVAADPGLD